MTPRAYFDDVWRRCGEIESLHNYLAAQLTAALSPDELLRAEWVARVSALDLYVHELVAQNMSRIFEGTRPVCSGFSRFLLPTEALMRIRMAATTADAATSFDLEVRTRLRRMTFQSPDDIADGIRLVSACELWNEISAIIRPSSPPKDTAKGLRRTLSLIVERRNKIAHESDLQPSIPRMPWPISRTDVNYVANFIGEIVSAIGAVV